MAARRALIRSLDPEQLALIEQHLLSLSEHDRYLRFGYPAIDEQIQRYVAKLDFARDELLTALVILQQGHIPPDRMIGSWAGAMGYTQFLPSDFEKYAVDFDGDGIPDFLGGAEDGKFYYLKNPRSAAAR